MYRSIHYSSSRVICENRRCKSLCGPTTTISGVSVCLQFPCRLAGCLQVRTLQLSRRLFDSPVTLHQPQKASLSDALWEKLSEQIKTGPTGQVKFVLVGGALLHRVPWPKLVTYEELCQKYCHYVQWRYGGDCHCL